MPRITMRQLLDHAAEHSYGVPAFNINNMEQALAIMEAASSLDAAQYCIDMSVAYARNRKVFGKPLAANQAIQFPLAEAHTEAEPLHPEEVAVEVDLLAAEAGP